MLIRLFAWWRGWGWGLLLAAGAARAQVPTAPGLHPATAPAPLDMADVAHRLWARLPAHDSASLGQGHRMLLLVPVVGYSQQTSGVAELALNSAFRQPDANVSNLVGAAQYTLRNQLIFTLQSAIWVRDNRWVLCG